MGKNTQKKITLSADKTDCGHGCTTTILAEMCSKQFVVTTIFQIKNDHTSQEKYMNEQLNEWHDKFQAHFSENYILLSQQLF